MSSCKEEMGKCCVKCDRVLEACDNGWPCSKDSGAILSETFVVLDLVFNSRFGISFSGSFSPLPSGL